MNFQYQYILPMNFAGLRCVLLKICKLINLMVEKECLRVDIGSSGSVQVGSFGAGGPLAEVPGYCPVCGYKWFKVRS